MIGNIIEQVLRERGISVTDFACKINTNRNNIYNIFKRETIDTGLLLRICNVLQYNFFAHYMDMIEKQEIIIKKVPHEYFSANKFNKKLDTVIAQNRALLVMLRKSGRK